MGINSTHFHFQPLSPGQGSVLNCPQFSNHKIQKQTIQKCITIGYRLTVLRWIRSTTDYLDFMEDLDNNKITPIVIISTPVQSGHPMTDLFIQALILRHHRRQKTTIKLKGINC